MINGKQLPNFYNAYIDYLSACVHALITHKVSPILHRKQMEFEEAAYSISKLSKYDDDDMLVGSLTQLTLSLHQLARNGFCSEVRGMIHHPLEDMLSSIIRYIHSLDPTASNDPMICILEDEIDALLEIQHECIEEAPQDAGNLALMLSHLKDIALCLHSFNHIAVQGKAG